MATRFSAQRLFQPLYLHELMFLNRTAFANAIVVISWLTGLLTAAVFVHMDLGYALEHGEWRSAGNSLLGRDFVNVYSAGHLLLAGDLTFIYDIPQYRAYQYELFDGYVINHNYSYTPVSFFFVWIFALVPYGASYILWVVLTGGAFLLAARPYLKDSNLPVWICAIMPAIVANLWAGHYGFLFGGIWLAAWRLMETRPRLAGVLIGLMLVKPHLAILMPLVLLRRGAWQTILYAAATTIGLILLSGAIFGWDLWRVYVQDTLFYQASLVKFSGEFYISMMPTVFPAAAATGLSASSAWIVQGFVAVAAIASLMIWLPRNNAHACFATATATFLVLPYAFNYDMTIVGLGALLMLHRWSGRSLIMKAVAGLCFAMPMAFVLWNLYGYRVGPLILIPMLISFLALRWHTKREEDRATEGSDSPAPTPAIAASAT